MVDGGQTLTTDLVERPARRILPSRRSVLLVLGPAVLIAGAAWFYLTGGRVVTTDNAYVRADLVQLSTDVSGIVKAIEVTDNQPVERGQVLFRLDDGPYRFAVADAAAQLTIARNQVEVLKADWREKQQEIRQVQVTLDFAERDWKRKNELFGQHVVPQSGMDQAQQALDAARQQLQTAQQQLASIAASLGGNPEMPTEQSAQVRAAQARLDEAQHNLDDTVVRAPMAGIVTNVPSLQLGHYLAASSPGFGLVASNDVWIEANPKETQLTWVRPGQPVTITVDTYPGVEWSGTVASLSPASASEFALLPAQNTSGNWVKVLQRIPVRISVRRDPDKPILRSGMSAEVSIDTGHRRTLGDLLALVGL